MQLPHQAERLAQRVGRGDHVAGRQECLVPVDREIRRQGRGRRRAGLVEVEARRRATHRITMPHRPIRDRGGRSPAPPDTSGPGRPTRRRATATHRRPDRSADTGGQDQLAADARVGVLDGREQRIEIVGRVRCLRLRLAHVLDVPLAAHVAAEDADGLLSDLRILIFQCGDGDRVPLDREQGPQGPGAVDRLAVLEEGLQGGNAPLTLRDQAAAGGVLGGDVRRLQPGDQPVDRAEVRRRPLPLRALRRHPINPAGRLVAEAMAADACVVPVGDEDRAVRRRAGRPGGTTGPLRTSGLRNRCGTRPRRG